MVIFSATDDSFYRRTRSQRARTRRSAGRRQEDLPFYAARRVGGRPQNRKKSMRSERLPTLSRSVKLPDGNIKVFGRGCRARARAIFDRHGRGILPRDGAPCWVAARRAISASRSDRSEDHRTVRTVHQAFAEPELRHHDCRPRGWMIRRASRIRLPQNLQLPVG